MNVCTTGNFRVQYSSCPHTAVATGNVMFLFMALNQVVLCSLKKNQPCSADHERDWPPCEVVFCFFRVGNQYAECEKQQQLQQTDVPQKMLRIFSWRSRCTAVPQETNTKFTEPEGAPRFLWSVMSQPTSRLPLLLSAPCGTAYDALMSPLFSGATHILKSSKNFENNGSKSQGPR